jgi:hypothetical protein
MFPSVIARVPPPFGNSMISIVCASAGEAATRRHIPTPHADCLILETVDDINYLLSFSFRAYARFSALRRRQITKTAMVSEENNNFVNTLSKNRKKFEKDEERRRVVQKVRSDSHAGGTARRDGVMSNDSTHVVADLLCDVVSSGSKLTVCSARRNWPLGQKSGDIGNFPEPLSPPWMSPDAQVVDRVDELR